MTIGTSAIWGAKLSRSPLYDISVSWIKLKKPAVPIVTLWTDYQLVPVLWVRHHHISSITIFCCYANTERGFSDRKSTRLNSSHVSISYAVFCLKKKKKNIKH